MFNAIDKDRSGSVDADELKESFVALGIPLTDADVRGMLKDAGVEGSLIFYEGTGRLIDSHPGRVARFAFVSPAN